MDNIRKEYILEGLDCAHCAAKIEEGVSKLESVRTASMNFMTKTLTVESGSAHTDILRDITSVVHKLEPEVTVSEKNTVKPQTLLLQGLDCAHCAEKIGREISALDGIRHASVDFVGKRLIYEAITPSAVLTDTIIHRVSSVEPGVTAVVPANQATVEPESVLTKEELLPLLAGGVLFAAGLLLKLPFYAELAVFLVSYAIVGGPVLLRAAKNISRGQIFDENFLMAVATLGAFAIKEFPEGVAVMLFYQIGELFQSVAVNRSRRSIQSLMDIRPDSATLLEGTMERVVSPEEVHIGDTILVRPGERVPLDGQVLSGQSSLDTSALTGESLPRDVVPGDDVLSGFINKSGLLTLRVTREFGESTVAKILDLVQNASSKKGKTENFITKFARYYTPFVVFAALALAVIPPLVMPDATFATWVSRALVFLVVSCPCALVISIPLGFFGGIGGASKNGILIKGSNFLEALNGVETVVFDKTGTLTRGVFSVSRMHEVSTSSGMSLLEAAALAESYSSHPIAQSILRAYGRDIRKDALSQYDEIPGHGVRAVAGPHVILAGNERLMTTHGIAADQDDTGGTLIHVAVDGNYAGYLVISDEVKPDAADAIRQLKSLGVKNTVMLTGDNPRVATRVGTELGLDEVHAGLLPHEKVEKLEALDIRKSAGGKIVFVGDGINDAPVLARADIGIAMGGLGSDAAIEAADIVLMTDEPSRLADAIRIARRTRRIVWQNIVFALGVKAFVLVLGAGGIATMWEAVFADVGVAVIAILNAMRVMRASSRNSL